MIVSRRAMLAAMAAGVAGAARCARAPAPAASAACPSLVNTALRWIVPNAVGGGYDTESRLLAPFLEKHLGARITIENLPGAGQVAGARAIATAAPDGRTLGIIGVPGLLTLSLAGEPDVPNPATDFTVLGRVSRSWHVWATGKTSPLGTVDALFESASRRPLIFGISEVSSPNFISITGATEALGLPVEFVAGFSGTRNASLAAIRGDVDLVSFNFDTIRDLIAAGDLRPLLQVSHPPGSSDPLLEGVPVFGGSSGVAARRAHARGRDATAATATAAAVIDLVGTGRVVVAPRGLDAALTSCLSSALQQALAAQVAATPARTIDAANGVDAHAEIVSAASRVDVLLPPFRRALAALRRAP